MSVSTLTYLPGNFRPQERKFQGTNVPWNKFVPENESSRGRKFQGTKVPPCGTTGTKVPVFVITGVFSASS